MTPLVRAASPRSRAWTSPPSPEPVWVAASARKTSSRLPRPPRHPLRQPRRPRHRSRCLRCAAPRSRCRACARFWPSAPSSPCSRPLSSPRLVEVDVTALADYRDSVKASFLEKTGDKLSFLPFFALATAEALQAFPIVNATVDGENIVYPASENVSIAVDTERGLLTPVLRDAASKNIAQIAHEIADLAARTRDNKLKPDELAGGTFTLTNTGSRGALFDTPVVFLPQSAILGTGHGRQASRPREGRRCGCHRDPFVRVPRPLVRPPDHRWCGCSTVPGCGEGPPRVGAVRRSARRLTDRAPHGWSATSYTSRTSHFSSVRMRTTIMCAGSREFTSPASSSP